MNDFRCLVCCDRFAKHAKTYSQKINEVITPEKMKKFHSESCHLSEHPQGTKEWLNERKNMCTGSTAEAWMGMSKFQSQVDIARIIRGDVTVPVTEPMKYGSMMEPAIRTRYQEMLQEKHPGTFIEEQGLAIFNKDPRFGSSVDGIIFFPDGSMSCLEIKTTQKTLRDFIMGAEKWKNTRVPNPENISAPTSHLLQMYQACGVTGLSSCHYVVYSRVDNDMYIAKLDANPEYWEQMQKVGRLFIRDYLMSRKYEEDFC